MKPKRIPITVKLPPLLVLWLRTRPEGVTATIQRLIEAELDKKEITMENLTREQAIEQIGMEAVERVENENCEPTSRLMPDHMRDTVEWSASVTCESLITGVEVVLTVYYYTDKSELVDKDGDPIDDLSNVDWIIDHYTVG